MDRVTVATKRGDLVIIFRNLDEPLPFGWPPKMRWQVEAYEPSSEQPPLGIGWVIDFSPKRPRNREEEIPPCLEWIRVFHGYTRGGVATAITDAARLKWPILELSCAATDEGAAFMSWYLSNAEQEGDEGKAFADRNKRRLSVHFLPS